MGHKGLRSNVDGTCYTYGYEVKKTKVAKVKVNQLIKGKSIKVAPVANEPSTGLFTIKSYLLIFAEGIAGNPIYIIEDKGMDKGSYDKHKVPGMGFGVSPEDNYGWVIYTFDRSLTTEFNRRILIKLHLKKH
jgi:hypothetical protein